MPKDELPKITLYTKDPCPLCDQVKLKLHPYLEKNILHLELVDISQKENVKWWELYKYEIPVLFLNNEFLCKHSLDERLLQIRLERLQ